MIKASKGNFFTRKIKDETDVFLDDNGTEKIKFYLMALEYLQDMFNENEDCNMELTDEILTMVNDKLSLKTEKEVHFGGGYEGSSTISFYDESLSLVKQYYSAGEDLQINIMDDF